MISEFVSVPQKYREESAESFRFWTTYLPVFCFFFIPILAWATPEFFDKWFHSERYGILEFQHFLFPLITAFIGLRLAFSKIIQSDPLLLFWCIAMFIGGIYLAGEEASWGQHYFGWITPDFWIDVNDQKETNLHNVSNLFDQLPRAFLVIGIVVTGIIYPWILLKRPGLLPRRFNFTFPPLALVPIAIMTSACWGYRALHKIEATKSYIQYRPGEFQEVYIVWYLLYYALFMLWRERREREEIQQA